MMRMAIVAGLMVLVAAPSFASSNHIMSRYSGGSSEILSRYPEGRNYYYNPRGSRGPTGYRGANAPIHRNTHPVRRAASAKAWGANLPAPCGNFQRVQPRHCAPTKAWDSSFRSVYR